jgi:pimeloyl-ACP methyl ester carboxylesterase
MIGATNDLLITHKLSKIKNKTLVIWGEKDNLIPFEKNRQGIEMLPNAEVKVIKNAGHVVSIEKAKEFNMATLDFLK